MSIILIIVIFGIIVFFHEFGHFIVAKANHITVMEFSIGMGPAIFTRTKNGTKYALRLLPLGGYCMMLGEEEDLEDENAFNNKPLWARMLVIAAGPIFNFILAFIFSVIMIHYTGVDPAIVSEVKADSVAESAGISEGDIIREIDGKKIRLFREVMLYLQLHNSGEPINVMLEDSEGKMYETTVTPVLDSSGVYTLGIDGDYYALKGVGTHIKYASYECRYWIDATVTSLKMMFTGKVKSDELMGPVGVGDAFDEVIDEVTEESPNKKEAAINVFLNVLNWCILLSVNLGIMNLLPIPALDGGRLLFLLIELIRRKKIPTDKEAVVNFVGFVILIGIMILVFFNDIKNVFFK